MLFMRRKGGVALGEYETRFGIRVDKLHPPSEWSVGVCLSHWANETYLYINLFFITISIGKLGFEIENGK